ncbi:cell division protein DivIVA [Micromonospora terminaliae]|uniref:Cell division protein DivIVA n=1 Tax=Micromonospora terminaliae TaxID=1914461 RepID=A0AAJ2ZBN0_9ACTN|nr:cell division protein DivIVA [Micromonospora terminaliae]NES27250.1 cell division protein DivIVA [Micromonospora terminaliae]QGL47996.1 cell division protein DivIVA [Micromonospora terminaliae]
MTDAYRGGPFHGAGLPARLTAHGARIRVFDPCRRGVDPEQVREFQSLVADELSDLHRWIRLLGEENGRLRRALRDWQTMHARECRPPNQGHW